MVLCMYRQTVCQHTSERKYTVTDDMVPIVASGIKQANKRTQKLISAIQLETKHVGAGAHQKLARGPC